MNPPFSDKSAGSGFRPEIQGLRALAIVAVLIFHIWPESAPGGYSGVDVFFVISGYLITAILYQDIKGTGRISIGRFYARRIRRLLPAATLVLASTALLMHFLPATRWESTSREIIASAVYLQNWWLSFQSVDYLAAESAPSLLNHFWSLSVEEQYYIAWPAILFALGIGTRYIHLDSARAFRSLVICVVAASLAYSIWLTHTNPAQAYFSTFTRAWELGIGSILAVTTRWRAMPQRLRDGLGIAGVLMMVLPVALYDKSTRFPGYTALLPTVGCALVILAQGSPNRISAYTVLRTSPLQFLGDISYSLYLWHWPVIISFSAITGGSLGAIEGLTAITISCVLAYSTKQLVEDRFRLHAGENNGVPSSLLLAALCILIACASAIVAPWALGKRAAISAPPGLHSEPRFPGASALFNGTRTQRGNQPNMSLAEAKEDLPAPYQENCIGQATDPKAKICSYGRTGGTPRVLLLGDAYAAQWQPAVSALAQANNWDLHVIARSGCPLGVSADDAVVSSAAASCTKWQASVRQEIASFKPAVVLLTQNPWPRLANGLVDRARSEFLANGLKEFAEQTTTDGARVLFVRSTPYLGSGCNDVVCSRPRNRSLISPDPAVLAAGRSPPGSLLDLTDGICRNDRCDAVVGNVVVYRNPGLLTATYAKSMSEFLASRLQRIGILKDAIRAANPVALSSQGQDIAEQALFAKNDNPDLYKDGCHMDQFGSAAKACMYGPGQAAKQIVLVGDSHAAQWLPPLQELAARNHWRIYSFTKSACSFTDAPIELAGQAYSSCMLWNKNVMREISRLKPALVVTSQSRTQAVVGSTSPEDNVRRLASGLESRWRSLGRLGIPVLAIADTPWMYKDIPDCLSTPNYRDGVCNIPLRQAESKHDSLLDAHRSFPASTLASFNGRICSDQTCHAIVDGMIAFRDSHHLTATYSRSLSPALERSVDAALHSNR